jgi:Lrp/AsnC family leucine-responsive transcriptional regulator
MKAVLESSKIVDITDLNILCCLRENSRETLTKMSKVTRIPISSIFDRLRKLESIGVISKHTSLLDMEKIGLNMRVILLIKANGGQRAELEKRQTVNPHVNTLIRTTGTWDFVAEVIFLAVERLGSFLESLDKNYEGIEVSVQHVLKELRRESFLADCGQNRSSRHG